VVSFFSSSLAIATWMGLALVVWVLLTRFRAPYGRHHAEGWGPTVPANVAWVSMELPALLVLPICFVAGVHWTGTVSVVFLLLWLAHYLHRALIYPFLSRVPGRPMPLSVLAFGVGFNLINGGFIGTELFLAGPPHETGWLQDGRFVMGLAVFVIGMGINIRSDVLLRRLRWTQHAGYRIPHGFMFRWVSCPNYLGEMIEWLGFALLTWSVSGVAFALWTIANLLPRAISHHRWYLSEFPDYPADRKALVPYLL
jgi:3-oxo-5-alpha-steroid 4-dehydrogenase 1